MRQIRKIFADLQEVMDEPAVALVAFALLIGIAQCTTL